MTPKRITLVLLLGLATTGGPVFRLAWQSPSPVSLQVRQLIRVQSGELGPSHQSVPLYSEEWTERYEPLRRELDVDLWASRILGRGEPDRMRFRVERFRLGTRLGESELSPVGAQQMEGLELQVDFDSRGPRGPIRLADPGQLDASNWSVMQPLAEVVCSFLQLSLPASPEQAPVAGDSWSLARQVPAGLADAPGTTMDVYSFYLLLGHAPCGTQRCARIEEWIHARLDGHRQLGDSLVDIRLQGFGRASHLVPLAAGLPFSVRGELSVEVELSSRLALGMPASFQTRSLLQSSWSLAPDVERR